MRNTEYGYKELKEIQSALNEYGNTGIYWNFDTWSINGNTAYIQFLGKTNNNFNIKLINLFNSIGCHAERINRIYEWIRISFNIKQHDIILGLLRMKSGNFV